VLVFRATSAGDANKLITFLARAFSASLDSEFLRPELLHWKFWAPREDYSEPRSYVLEKNERILAHVGIWPVSFQSKIGSAHGCHMIDWGSDPSFPGMGVALLRRISERFDFIYSIGGSDSTERILPIFGFDKIGEAWLAARPIRPAIQVLTHQHVDWRSPARLTRNILWSLFPWIKKLDDWKISQEDLALNRNGLRTPESPVCAFRPDGFFRYLESCPAAHIVVFRIQNEKCEIGRVALSILHNQARIVGVWLEKPSEQNLYAAYCLAQQCARRDRSAREIIAIGSTLSSRHAAISAGMRLRGITPIYLLRLRKCPLVPVEFQISDYDRIFLSNGRTQYLT
jgi:hypothetical protein